MKFKQGDIVFDKKLCLMGTFLENIANNIVKVKFKEDDIREVPIEELEKYDKKQIAKHVREYNSLKV